MFSTAAGARRWTDARVKNGELRKNMPAGRGRCARPAELVKKGFLTSSQTRPTSLGSRLKRLRLAAAHSLTLARLRAEKYFCRCACHRQKCFALYLRLRAQTLRGFFDRMKRDFFHRSLAFCRLFSERLLFDHGEPAGIFRRGGRGFRDDNDAVHGVRAGNGVFLDARFPAAERADAARGFL